MRALAVVAVALAAAACSPEGYYVRARGLYDLHTDCARLGWRWVVEETEEGPAPARHGGLSGGVLVTYDCSPPGGTSSVRGSARPAAGAGRKALGPPPAEPRIEHAAPARGESAQPATQVTPRKGGAASSTGGAAPSDSCCSAVP